MYKLVVSSFDGTLLDKDDAISISTVLTIDEIRRKNCKFVVATSRGLNFVKEYIKDVNFIDYIIALNGSYIYDATMDKVIFAKAMSKTIIRKIVKKYQEKGVKIYLCTDHSKCYLNIKVEKTKEIIIRDLNDFLQNNKVYKIEIHTKTNKLGKEILKELETLNIDVNSNLHKYETKDYLVELTAKDISKYTAIKRIIKREKIQIEEVVAFGDYSNDLELVSKAGLGISMKNASKEVKKASNQITNSNNEKGVETSLVNIFLKE